ncbi:1700010B08Rik [Phodopus roborovskii]|uniref:1700010B08Rik protein n=1 Tax=Phodopus roborovskii TaxID=109678 RepID=A0AAV0AFQ1_PHORO|nr:1700010B08Rik [Phodopus roborovskii]
MKKPLSILNHLTKELSLKLLNHLYVDLSAPSPTPFLPACHHASCHDNNGLNLQTLGSLIMVRGVAQKNWVRDILNPKGHLKDLISKSESFSKL